jgi:hypothetical protein
MKHVPELNNVELAPPKKGVREFHIRKPSDTRSPTLRPPTLMIDLLFGALMLFAFQMGDPNSRPIVPHDFELPTSDRTNKDAPAALLPLKPVRGDKDLWLYETPEGKRLTAEQIATAVNKKNKTAVLLVKRSASVQDYLNAEEPLRRLGLKIGLAVALEEGTKK